MVEHRIARMVQLRVRQARYLGSRKVGFQVALTAAVANVGLLLGLPHALGALLALFLLVGASRAPRAATWMIRHDLVPVAGLGSFTSETAPFRPDF